MTLPLTQALAEFAADKDIQVNDKTGTALLGEQSLRAIPATPNLYLGEGESAVAAFQVYDSGRPATSDGAGHALYDERKRRYRREL